MLDQPSRNTQPHSATPAEEAVEPPDDSSVRLLGLEAAVDSRAGGWSIRLPVRAEHITVTKETIVLEEVRIWRAAHEETETVSATVRSEQLQVDNVAP